MTTQHLRPRDEEDAEACLYAMQLGLAGVLPMALKAAIELDVLETIAQAGPGESLSPAEIAAKLPTDNPDAPAMLDRILRLLASHSILTCSISEGRPRYGLTPVCRYLTTDENGVSMASMVLMIQGRVFTESWYHLKDTVLNGGVPFNRAHGMSVFEFREADDRFREVFDASMWNKSICVMRRMLDTYSGFDGLDGRVVVDVGGGAGAAIGMIVSKHPGIRGINFDLPHVVEKAPICPGVEHVGGDMFECVPNGDVIFIKSVLHNWSDEKCLQVLKNCWIALPESGKVIFVESVLPAAPENTMVAQHILDIDLTMLALFPGGKVRREEEYEALAKAAGFTGFTRVCSAFSASVFEFSK